MRAGTVVGTLLDIRSGVWSDPKGEGGLLSVAFHPGYAQNHLFYVDYTDLNRDTHVVEYRTENGVAVPRARASFSSSIRSTRTTRADSCLRPRGLLYVGMGDGGSNPDVSTVNDPDNRAQDLTSRLGKLLRIDPLRAGADWQMIGYGLRNPWRFSFDRQTGDLWIGDVGAGSREEVDFRTRASIGSLANFGWSRFEGEIVYNPKIKLQGKGSSSTRCGHTRTRSGAAR